MVLQTPSPSAWLQPNQRFQESLVNARFAPPQLLVPRAHSTVQIKVVERKPPTESVGLQFPDERYLREQETQRLATRKERASRMVQTEDLAEAELLRQLREQRG